MTLTLSSGRSLLYRKKSINLQSKSMYWFLYDTRLRHERVKKCLETLIDRHQSFIKHKKNMWNSFKVNYKDPRTMWLTSFFCLYFDQISRNSLSRNCFHCWLWTSKCWLAISTLKILMVIYSYWRYCWSNNAGNELAEVYSKTETTSKRFSRFEYLKAHVWKLAVAEGTPYIPIIFVNDKTRVAYKTCRRAPIRHGSFIHYDPIFVLVSKFWG